MVMQKNRRFLEISRATEQSRTSTARLGRTNMENRSEADTDGCIPEILQVVGRRSRLRSPPTGAKCRRWPRCMAWQPHPCYGAARMSKGCRQPRVLLLSVAAETAVPSNRHPCWLAAHVTSSVDVAVAGSCGVSLRHLPAAAGGRWRFTAALVAAPARRPAAAAAAAPAAGWPWAPAVAAAAAEAAAGTPAAAAAAAEAAASAPAAHRRRRRPPPASTAPARRRPHYISVKSLTLHLSRHAETHTMCIAPCLGSDCHPMHDEHGLHAASVTQPLACAPEAEPL